MATVQLLIDGPDAGLRYGHRGVAAGKHRWCQKKLGFLGAAAPAPFSLCLPSTRLSRQIGLWGIWLHGLFLAADAFAVE